VLIGLICGLCAQLLLRHVSPEVFGMASVPLDLLLNTALFLARYQHPTTPHLTISRTPELTHHPSALD
jgi:hypothetical protein